MVQRGPVLLFAALLSCGKPREVPGELVFTGMCDASAAVALDAQRFLVADDEDNVLRAYDQARPGAPLWSVDVSAAIGVRAKPGQPAKEAPESDIEAATRLGDLAFWMTSHGRSSRGKLKPERFKLFATRVPEGSQTLEVVGKPYEQLLGDLIAHPSLSRFDLKAAAELAPKAAGGLNLEGMTARREGGVWIGFRNPIPAGKALLVPLLNPERLMFGEAAALGEPRLLELGGLGVRAIAAHGSRYLILAGPFDGRAGTRLFSWDGVAQPKLLVEEPLRGLNGEGFFTPPGRDEVLILSDDGSLLIGDKECKRLHDASKKRFRARPIKL